MGAIIVFKKVYDYCIANGIKEMSDPEYILLRNYEREHGNELDAQIDEWLKASKCYDIKQFEETGTAYHPWI